MIQGIIKTIVLNSLIIIYLLKLSSCTNSETRPIKFKLHEQYLDCKGIYSNDKLKDVLCYYDNGNIKMSKRIIGSSDSSTHVFYYSNGKIKEEGIHLGNNPIGVWQTYFGNGNLESYKYHKIIRDSSFIIYEKMFNKDGLLESSILPLDIEVAEKALTKGNSYNLKIELKYSEFDSVHSIVFFDKNEKIKFEQDSIYSMSRIVNTTFNPLYSGDLIITGTYAELGANEIYSSELMIAKKPFAIKIYVKK